MKGGITLEQLLRRSNPWAGVVVSVQNASHAVLEEVATVGVSLLHTSCGVRSVGSRWRPTKESLVGMASDKVRSTWTTRPLSATS